MPLLARDRLLDTLRRDLIGPQIGDDEVISAHPIDQYMTGILYPIDLEAHPEDDDDREAGSDDEGDSGPGIPMSSLRRPNVMGLSFALEGTSPRIRVKASLGRYELEESPSETGKPDRTTRRWRRSALQLEHVFDVRQKMEKYDEVHGLEWYVRGHSSAKGWQVTVALVNANKPGPGRDAATPVTFFQAEFQVQAEPGARLIPRQPVRAQTDDDSLSHAVIYRHAEEWAVGHTCGADWRVQEQQRIVATTWLPQQRVVSVNADGHPYFNEASRKRTNDPRAAFDARKLAEASPEQLAQLLEAVPEAYERWLMDQRQELVRLEAAGSLTPDAIGRARQHFRDANGVLVRMRNGIELLSLDAPARRAFQLAQTAMSRQREWASAPSPAVMQWRPFQLGFLLLSLAGIARPMNGTSVSPDRLAMDLLWFPTGGGKTEAYLGLIAFTLFLRRLRQPDSPDEGAGVAVLMRYTLRLLTIQQFERASRLILACESIRRASTKKGDISLGSVPFSIGLWVGSGATPNTVEDARKPEGRKRAQQLARCPACNGKTLKWDCFPKSRSFEVRCENKQCPVYDDSTCLPIYTIDEELYRARPSLVIGTIDKFAQIVRKKETRALLGSGNVLPPELIIQDELHLISGPLGSVAGLYEAAIDLICTHDQIPPKIIGSTATIRRAEDQVRQLFNRSVTQFPPPVLDARDSCFSIEDPETPGRLYAGISTAGRSAKFVLQAVCASLMQSASEPHLSDKERDPYWTLVAYFNALRELGGALVMLQDDVKDSMENFARLHGHPVRKLDEEPMELTSRVDQTDIPQYLVDLEQPYPNQPYASVLATNMISVGVDIPRLGLMVVNGQPKGMSEYIQATSRVGRNKVPGLVVTVYNVARPRDRSHFEAFRTWHQTLYREVEATSVTPFSPRARDRALHATIVALARHRVMGLHEKPEMTEPRRLELERLIDALIQRVGAVEAEELVGTRDDAAGFLDSWEGLASGLQEYWNDYKPSGTLLVSAERVVTVKASTGSWNSPARATLNSMREVEPGVLFRMTGSPAGKKEARNE